MSHLCTRMHTHSHRQPHPRMLIVAPLTPLTTAPCHHASSCPSREVSLYDFERPGFSETTGHFTQLVWVRTQQVGCAIGVCPNGVSVGTVTWRGKLYVCEYWPPGRCYCWWWWWWLVVGATAAGGRWWWSLYPTPISFMP